ncbi:MAG: hypothetical protein QOH89_3426 [Pseudonocardiales bacterium]|nr:hypothetical protein [Pseudonocardiales bacterium]
MTGVLPPSLRGLDANLPRVLSVRGARQLGMSPDAVAHAVHAFGWQRLVRGYLLTGPGPPSRADWINVGLELATPTGAISGWDAVRIAGLGEPEPPRREVLILARAGEHRLMGGVRIRPTRRPYRTWTLPGEHPDLPYAEVVHTARAIADTGLQYRRFRPVRALVTGAIQRRACTIDDLIGELESGPRNGSGWLRRALADALDGAKSIAEAEALDVLRHSPVPEFEANVPIITSSGVLIAEADCLWRELRAVEEIDSRSYHFSEGDWDATRAKHRRLGRHGVAVSHHKPAEIRDDPARFAKEVEQWLRARAGELDIPYRPADDPLRRPATPGKPTPFVVPDLLA